MVGAFSSGADAIAEQLRPSDRKSGRWSFPSAVIYGMLWPQAAALEMGWGGSKLLPLLGANNAFWKAIPAVPVPDASPGNPCLQPEDAGPASGRHFHVEARAAPVVAGLSLCSGCSWPPPPACPVPCHGSCVSLGSLLPCVAQGCVGRGVHPSGRRKDFHLLKYYYWRRGGHWGSILYRGSRKELVGAVASYHCHGLWKTSAGSFLLALYPWP